MDIRNSISTQVTTNQSFRDCVVIRPVTQNTSSGMDEHKNIFCGFSMGNNQYRAGRVYDLYVYFMIGTPEGFLCGLHFHQVFFYNKFLFTPGQLRA